MQMPIWLEKRSMLTPNRTALQMGDRKLSFLELRNRARAVAVKLQALDIKKGDVVACLSGNDIAVVEIVHALHYAGAIFLPLNSRLSAYEQTFQLKDGRVKLLLHADELIDATRLQQLSEEGIMCHSIAHLTLQDEHDISRDSDSRVVSRYADIEASANQQQEKTTELSASQQNEPAKLASGMTFDDVQTIMYTSGTTGTPKGVIISGQNHYTGAIGSALNMGMHADDCWLLAVPMFHISGLSILMRSVIYGMRVVILEKFHEATANEAIMKQGVTIMSVVSNMLSRMLIQLGDDHYPPAFRCMLLGGGPAPKPLLEACVAKSIPVVQTYGMTETAAQIVTLAPEYMLEKLGSAGKPLFQAQLRIMNAGQQAEPHEAGDIQVYGEQVTSGYLHRPEANSESFTADGWFNTGDMGYLDNDGFLYVLDRRKDMFVSGGENVYPAEIEAALLADEQVVDAGVTSVTDELWGYVGAAYIVLAAEASQQMMQGELDEQEVQKQLMYRLRERLAKYKLPKYVYIVEQLPRNASNKLLRRELGGTQ